MAKKSAGLLMYRRQEGHLQVFLVHPGGPEWVRRDAGAWSIPKGEYQPDEDPLSAATREFEEETSFTVFGPFTELTPVKQPGGSDATQVKSNTFSMEWPPRSGRQQTFPEVDRAAWFDLEEAKQKILKGQVPLLEELQHKLSSDASWDYQSRTLPPLSEKSPRP